MNLIVDSMSGLNDVSCPACGKTFRQLTPRQIYCSKICFVRGQKHPGSKTPPLQERRHNSAAPEKRRLVNSDLQPVKKTILQSVKKQQGPRDPGAQGQQPKPSEVLRDSLGRKHYPHRYRFGKQEQLLNFQDVQEKVERIKNDLSQEGLAYFWLVYYTGVRKSEAYERIIEDAEITDSHFIIDFHQRKKHGSQVPALKLPKTFPGIDILCNQFMIAQKKKPSKKLLIYSPMKGKKQTKTVKAQWIFPHINRTWADVIIKKILGPQYYPHFLRLNRLSEIGSDESASLTRLKSFSGIRSIKAMEAYLGVTEKEQDAAIDFMARQINQEKER